MGKLLIKPKVLNGSVLIPPSKSISHRALIAAGMCDVGKKSIIENIIMSDDIIATSKGLENLGVRIESIKTGDRFTLLVEREVSNVALSDVDCKESGSTLRFLIPISLLYADKAIFEGKGRLAERSLQTYYKIFDMKGISYSNVDGRLPLTVSGMLSGGNYTVDSRVSSQFLTGLLFTLPKLREASTVYVSDELQSKGYIDLTLDLLEKFGIVIETTDYSVFRIKGNQHYDNIRYAVDGDYSQAAFFLIANELGSSIDVHGLNEGSKQGDKRILDIINDIREIKRINKAEKNTDIDEIDYVLDASQIPDLVPILAVYFSLQDGLHTRITNAERLRYKESDRLEAMASQLKKLGADIKELKDGLEIHGRETLKGACEVSSVNDHRIAMAIAIAATKCSEAVELSGFEAVTKSYPDFFKDYRKLGGEVYELDMGK